MHRLTTISPFCGLMLNATAQEEKLAPEPSFADDEPRAIAWRRDFHEYPELSNQEFRTAGIGLNTCVRPVLTTTGPAVEHSGVRALSGLSMDCAALHADDRKQDRPARVQRGRQFRN